MRIAQRARNAASPMAMPMRSHKAGSQASSICRMCPASAIASYSTRIASASAKHIFFVILVVSVAPIDFEAARRRRGQKHVGGASHGERHVDLFFKLGLAD